MEKVSGLNSALALAIKEAREHRGITQGQLEDFAGLSEAYISKLEQGKPGDSLNSLVLISRVLGIPLTEITSRIEEEMARGATQPKPRHGRPRLKKSSS